MTRAGPVTDVVPVVTLDGQEIAAAWAGDTALVAVDGLTLTWGRDAVLEQATPATGRLTLFDPTAAWATRTDPRGLPVTLGYRGTSPDGSTVSAVFFRGRVGSPPRVSRRTVRDPDGRRIDGALVELPLQSLLVDLANVVPRAAWPAEPMGDRLDRVLAAAQYTGVLTGGAGIRDYWREPWVAPVAAADQVSLLEHLEALFRSSGSDAMTYRPDTDTAAPVSDRTMEGAQTLARLTWDSSNPTRPRAGQGAFAATLFFDYPDPMDNALPSFLDSARLEYDPSDGVTLPPRITRVAISHPDLVDDFETRTVEVLVPRPDGLTVDEADAGIRTARIDSLVAWNDWADVALNDTVGMVRHEGSRWVLQPLRLSTRRTGGFETVDELQLLLAGHERNSLVFLQRSWLPRLGLRPVFGVLGGTIGYTGGGWDVELQVAPVATTTPQHALSWDEVDDGTDGFRLEWWDDDHPRGLHASLTYEDMAYVGRGLNVTADPAPTEWDIHQ